MNKQPKHPKVPIEQYLGLPGEPEFEDRSDAVMAHTEESKGENRIKQALSTFAHRFRDTR